MNTLRISLIALILLASGVVFAKDMVCQNDQIGKKFVIKSDSVAFYGVDDEQDVGRGVASVNQIRTRKIGKSLTKIMKLEGDTLSLHIQNVDTPSLVDDYMSLRSARGHEVIYPLSCSSI